MHGSIETRFARVDRQSPTKAVDQYHRMGDEASRGQVVNARYHTRIDAIVRVAGPKAVKRIDDRTIHVKNDSDRRISCRALYIRWHGDAFRRGDYIFPAHIFSKRTSSVDANGRSGDRIPDGSGRSNCSSGCLVIDGTAKRTLIDVIRQKASRPNHRISLDCRIEVGIARNKARTSGMRREREAHPERGRDQT